MSLAYARKKQPEIVRRKLLDAAQALALQDGLGAITVQAVAAGAGVTKGALFHHFASKQALVDAVVDELFEGFDEDIETFVAADPEPYGRFTRAYVRANFDDAMQSDVGQQAALYASMLTDPALRRRWSRWLEARLAHYGDMDNSIDHQLARLAADGVWIASLHQEGETSLDRQAMLQRLLGMTYRRSA